MKLLPASLHLCLLAIASPAMAAATPTFNRDVAPVVFENCVACHHPGGVAPFPLTGYKEVRKHAKQIVEATGSHFMPPWLPEAGHGDFIGERRLSAEQITVLARWVETGTVEGPAADLKVKPQWNDGWQLGEPDLIVTMPDIYTLPADGHDVYRNFVIPAPANTDKYVVAAELRPGNAAVHHAFLKFDRRGGAQRLDAKDSEPGYPGMNAGASVEAPAGNFSSWQPGKVVQRSPDDMAWVLPGKSVLVVQMHMRPTGKPEKVRASVGFYFTDHRPERTPAVLCLRSTRIDIPAGATDHPVESSYKLPVDGEVLSVLPHLHYLGKEVHAWAELPDGTSRDLLLIHHWDFNWQGDYRYKMPMPLPAGTTVRMRYTYDNSAGNALNPHHPPSRVRYGLESTDEMGEFWFQFLPRNGADAATLRRDYIANFALPDELARLDVMLEQNPGDVASRADLAALLLSANRPDEARREAEQVIKEVPDNARAHSVLGNYWIDQNQVVPARTEFSAVVAADPEDADAQNNLGWLLLVEGKAAAAIEHLEKAIAINPNDTLAKEDLEKARAQLKK